MHFFWYRSKSLSVRSSLSHSKCLQDDDWQGFYSDAWRTSPTWTKHSINERISISARWKKENPKILTGTWDFRLKPVLLEFSHRICFVMLPPLNNRRWCWFHRSDFGSTIPRNKLTAPICRGPVFRTTEGQFHETTISSAECRCIWL